MNEYSKTRSRASSEQPKSGLTFAYDFRNLQFSHCSGKQRDRCQEWRKQFASSPKVYVLAGMRRPLAGLGADSQGHPRTNNFFNSRVAESVVEGIWAVQTAGCTFFLECGRRNDRFGAAVYRWFKGPESNQCPATAFRGRRIG